MVPKSLPCRSIAGLPAYLADRLQRRLALSVSRSAVEYPTRVLGEALCRVAPLSASPAATACAPAGLQNRHPHSTWFREGCFRFNPTLTLTPLGRW
jgi:hypothetical protein